MRISKANRFLTYSFSYSLHFQSPKTLIYEKIAWSIIQHHYNKVHGFKHYKKQFSGLTLISDDG